MFLNSHDIVEESDTLRAVQKTPKFPANELKTPEFSVFLMDSSDLSKNSFDNYRPAKRSSKEFNYSHSTLQTAGYLYKKNVDPNKGDFIDSECSSPILSSGIKKALSVERAISDDSQCSTPVCTISGMNSRNQESSTERIKILNSSQTNTSQNALPNRLSPREIESANLKERQDLENNSVVDNHITTPSILIDNRNNHEITLNGNNSLGANVNNFQADIQVSNREMHTQTTRIINTIPNGVRRRTIHPFTRYINSVQNIESKLAILRSIGVCVLIGVLSLVVFLLPKNRQLPYHTLSITIYCYLGYRTIENIIRMQLSQRLAWKRHEDIYDALNTIGCLILLVSMNYQLFLGVIIVPVLFTIIAFLYCFFAKTSTPNKILKVLTVIIYGTQGFLIVAHQSD